MRPTSPLAALLRPVRTVLIVGCVLQAIGTIAGVVPFVAVAELARVLVIEGDADGAWPIVAWAAGSMVVRLMCLLVVSGICHLADTEFQLRLRERLSTHLGRVPMGWFDDRSSGLVKKVFEDDVTAMHHLVAHSFTDFTAAVVGPLVSVGYLVVVDWRLALITCTPVVAGLGLYALQMRGYGAKVASYDEAIGELNAATVELVEGVAVLKAFGVEGRAHRRFQEAGRSFADRFWNWVRGLLDLAVASEIVTSPVACLAVVLGGSAALLGAGSLEPVDALPALLLGVGLSGPIVTLGYAANQFQVSRAAARRVMAILDVPELSEAERPLPPSGHRVEFEDVAFSYGVGADPAVSGIDLTLEPGTVTALVGPSGSGKSTLARLLPRFWDVDAGRILLGGVALTDVAIDDLYRHVSFVFQDVQLLRASVRENIRLARPDAADDDVFDAARAAAIHERILELPRGYDAVVGEDAVLSGGERQRLSIARALLADTPILVLDEATAASDPESESMVQAGVSRLAAGRTVLVIAHRLSTIVDADQIVVLDAGRIVERGCHDELVAAGGLYARMWAAHERVGAGR